MRKITPLLLWKKVKYLLGNIALPQEYTSSSMLTQNIVDYQYTGPELAGHNYICKESLQSMYANST